MKNAWLGQIVMILFGQNNSYFRIAYFYVFISALPDIFYSVSYTCISYNIKLCIITCMQ